MWIAKDSDNAIVLFQERPVWDDEFNIWHSDKWEADITEFPEIYKGLDIPVDQPMEVSVKIDIIQQ
jgi:hypothetical protein|nr:MAG TPA: hypothetical protein [Caudoviricetes sp.]